MTTRRIYDLTNATTLNAADKLPVDRSGGTSRSILATDFANAVRPYASTLEATTGTATDKVMHPANTAAAWDSKYNAATTAFGRSLVDDANASAARTTLGLAAIAASGSGADLANDSVANTVLANMAAATLKGRAVGAGAGDPTDLTALQAIAVLGIPAVFPTRAAAIAASINSATNIVVLNGYSAEGDGAAGAIYLRISTPGAVKAWHFQSADGAWWELRTRGVHQYLFGAVSDFSTNAQAAFQAAADYAADMGAMFFGAPGNFVVATPIVLRPGPVPDDNYNFYERGPHWRFDKNCVIRASASMDAIVQLGNHTYENIIRDGVIEGGQFDQNNLATRGVWATFVNKCVARGGQSVNTPTNGCGVQFGTTVANEFATVDLGYEGFAQDWRVIGTAHSPLATARTGTAGIRFVNTTDNQTRENVISGVKIGIQADFASGFDGKHIGNHFWNWSENGAMDYGFDLHGDNALIGNQQDGPFLYCARFRGPRNHVIGQKVNYGGQAADADNVAALWRLEQDTTNGTTGQVTVTNSGFKGTASKRIAAELSLGSGCTRADFFKDASNRYVNVNNLEPVSLGNTLAGRVTVSGGIPTLQSNSNNINTVTRNAAGSYTITFLRAIPTTLPINVTVITNGVFITIVPIEETANRTTTQVQFYFYNSSSALTDPGGFVISCVSI